MIQGRHARLSRDADVVHTRRVDPMKQRLVRGSEARWHATRTRVLAGDITRLSVDAVANAANSALAGGGGVDGAMSACATSPENHEAGPGDPARRSIRQAGR
jgi:hypothetical protein